MERNEIVLFESKDNEVKLTVTLQDETVWLNRNQIAELFGRDVKTIGKHINNALREELEDSTVANFATVQKEGEREVERNIEYYNLDMIISIGYRVKSKRGVEFRKWANSVLKQYILEGYVINEKRLQALEKTVDIQTKMLADVLDVEAGDILRAVNQYTAALTLLDQYDHQCIAKPEGATPLYRITYEDCMEMVAHMKDSFNTDVFGVEKETGKVDGIISSVYQSVFGQDAYPSLEEKAANLLYFMIKDHPFADGCKRIAASLFLEFLERNNALYHNGHKRIGDGELVECYYRCKWQQNGNNKSVSQ
ncbi:MAG: virulence RhuM family protein [Lachnospiraceae bacterium]|nr:virulence RhuM family protein [Lachnospiraceae bacterium]